MLRIRHCVECPKCLTRYAVSCSPYENGSYLQPTIEGCWDEYTLYCRCKAAASQWKSSEFMNCEVSAAAFERGYGTADEITVIRSPQQEWSAPHEVGVQAPPGAAIRPVPVSRTVTAFVSTAVSSMVSGWS